MMGTLVVKGLASSNDTITVEIDKFESESIKCEKLLGVRLKSVF